MRCLLVPLVLSAASLVASPAFPAENLPLVCEVAQASQQPSSSPPLSAVPFSSRWAHPRNAADPHDTFRTAAAFRATDFVWVYSLDSAFVQKMKQTGGRVYLAINSLVPDQPDKNERLRGRIVDLDGNRITAPWMRGWKDSYWGCANSPEYRASYIAYANRAVEIGSDGLQMDDPLMNLAAVKWGGCFCDHCMSGFRSYLKANTESEERKAWGLDDLDRFDYREYLKARQAPVGDAFAKYDGGKLKQLFVAFQEESVREFFKYVRGKIDEQAGRHVVFSSNNYAGRWQFPYDLFEFGMAELPEQDANPKIMYQRFAEARGRGKSQLFTLVPKTDDGAEVLLTRRVIATSYACGGHLIVPWDVYTGSDRPRYFGKPEQYADLYRFVRDHAELFDGYEDAAYLLPGLQDDRYAVQPPVAIQNPAKDAGDIAVLVRAMPGKPETPVVIHLVDWRSEPKPLSLAIQSRRFSRDGKLKAELLLPGKPAARLQGRIAGEQLLLDVPRLAPWGIVVVAPAKGQPGTSRND